MEALLQRTRIGGAATFSRTSSQVRHAARRAPVRAQKTRSTHRHVCQAVAQDSENGISKATTAAAAAKAPAASKPFTNLLRFQVPAQSVRAFEDEWQRRAADMKHYEGFGGFSMKVEDGEYVVTSSWNSIPQWEAYSLGQEIRRSHLPSGIYQRVPGRGEGFPEDFVPFVDCKRPVDAKY